MLGQSFSGVRIVRATHSQEREIEQFHALNQAQADAEERSAGSALAALSHHRDAGRRGRDGDRHLRLHLPRAPGLHAEQLPARIRLRPPAAAAAPQSAVRIARPPRLSRGRHPRSEDVARHAALSRRVRSARRPSPVSSSRWRSSTSPTGIRTARPRSTTSTSSCPSARRSRSSARRAPASRRSRTSCSDSARRRADA